MTPAAILVDLLNRRLSEIEHAVANRGEASHRAAVDRAASIVDQTLADFLRRESDPTHIRDRVASIRDWIALGELERASRELETLRARLDALSQIVRAPFVETGFKQRRYLAEKRNAGNERRKLEASEKHSAWQVAANEVWARAPSLTNTAVARAISAKFPGVQPDTIRRSIRKLA